GDARVFGDDTPAIRVPVRFEMLPHEANSSVTQERDNPRQRVIERHGSPRVSSVQCAEPIEYLRQRTRQYRNGQGSRTFDDHSQSSGTAAVTDLEAFWSTSVARREALSNRRPPP